MIGNSRIASMMTNDPAEARKILAAWDAAVAALYAWQRGEITVREEFQREQFVHSFGLATPLWVGFGGPR